MSEGERKHEWFSFYRPACVFLTKRDGRPIEPLPLCSSRAAPDFWANGPESAGKPCCKPERIWGAR
jgi:hypothetical protein